MSSSLNQQYVDKGLSGLTNIGNTCYLNSCMQVLSHTYELNDFLNKSEYKKRINKISDSVILLEWDKLREVLWSSNCTVAPFGFVKAIQNIAHIKSRPLFTGHAQNDVQEFLLFIIECFHNALAREVDMQITGTAQNQTDILAKSCYEMIQRMYKKEFSDMFNIFFGVHVSEISALTAEHNVLSVAPEPFSVISLSLPDGNSAPSLYDCLDYYCKPEMLTSALGNAWYNDATKEKEDVKRGIVFWSLPTILILDIKRWNQNNQKIHTLVDVPVHNADFSRYVKGYNPSAYIYDLYGICNHSGGSLGGHYTAYIKNANGKWYEFNDTRVHEIKEEAINTGHAYCFFYRKKTL
jgi:ubiquitin carboxyl-terminal hydrolase 8